MLSSAPPQAAAASAVTVTDLRCGYAGREVLKGISFSAAAGEFVGILGPNGAGKSTLVLALSGIIEPASGKIEILGTAIERLSLKERARRVAVLNQDGDMRFPFPCREVVAMGRYPHKKRWQMDSVRDMEAVEKALALTDTEVLADRLIGAVSGGERQRVLMAKSLAQESPVLILDEATSAMDIHRKLQIFRVLDRLNREDNLTVFAVMHDINLAALFCRRMLFLKEGKVEADGPTEEVLTPETLEAIYETRVVVQEIELAGKRQVIFLP
ncbi:MAG: ABC transporter ATP-binding protein [Desulfobacteraceae bacterium]|nr:ABC transporter ATP-binding protein [Desulfobacteraceae bacterium]